MGFGMNAEGFVSPVMRIARLLVMPVVVAGFARAADPVPDAAGPMPGPATGLAELRTLQASPGKDGALHARLRDHQIPLLAEHGIRTQAVLAPADAASSHTIHLLTAVDAAAEMDRGWDALRKDPKWLDVVAETEKDGPLVAAEASQRLVQTDWSPPFAPEKSDRPRVFELRTYTCPDPDRHAALMRRFQDHTLKLFEKHGMRNLVYWIPAEMPASRQKLVYLLSHDSEAAAKESFAAFRKDPAWIAAKDASEKRAGGSLTNAEKGVVSEFLVATEYSPLR